MEQRIDKAHSAAEQKGKTWEDITKLTNNDEADTINSHWETNQTIEEQINDTEIKKYEGEYEATLDTLYQKLDTNYTKHIQRMDTECVTFEQRIKLYKTLLSC